MLVIVLILLYQYDLVLISVNNFNLVIQKKAQRRKDQNKTIKAQIAATSKASAIFGAKTARSGKLQKRC